MPLGSLFFFRWHPRLIVALASRFRNKLKKFVFVVFSSNAIVTLLAGPQATWVNVGCGNEDMHAILARGPRWKRLQRMGPCCVFSHYSPTEKTKLRFIRECKDLRLNRYFGVNLISPIKRRSLCSGYMITGKTDDSRNQIMGRVLRFMRKGPVMVGATWY